MGSVKSTKPRVAVILGKETGTENIPVTVCHPLSGQVGMVEEKLTVVQRTSRFKFKFKKTKQILLTLLVMMGEEVRTERVEGQGEVQCEGGEQQQREGVRSTVPKVASNLAVKTNSETVPKTVCGQLGLVRPAVCHPLSGQVDTVGENGLTWALVGQEGNRPAEVKVREVVSNTVETV